MNEQSYDEDDDVANLPRLGRDPTYILNVRRVWIVRLDLVDALLDIGVVLAVERVDEECTRGKLEANHVPECLSISGDE